MWIPDWARVPNWLEYEIGSVVSWKEVSENHRDEHPNCYMCKYDKLDENWRRVKHAHHSIPVSEGGLNEDWNLVTLCQTHHNKVHGDISFPPWEPIIERLAVEAEGGRLNIPTGFAARVDKWLRGKPATKRAVTCKEVQKEFNVTAQAARKALNQLLEMKAGPVKKREREEGNSRTRWILRSKCLTAVKKTD